MATIQHVDRIIRKKDFDNMGRSIKVASIFRTLQGEAPFAGWPAVFLRLSGCNFGNKDSGGMCGFCDTDFRFDKGIDYSPEALLEKILRVYKPGDILVVTGGEPTLQQNLIDFMELAQEHFITIQIESNGTQAYFFANLMERHHSQTSKLRIARYVDEPGVYVVVSPKGFYKGNVMPKPSDTTLAAAGCLKFVIESKVGPHHTVPGWVDSSNFIGSVYVSPMAVYCKSYEGEVSSIWDAELVDQKATAANYVYAAQYAIENNYRLSVQSHLFTAIP